MELKESGIVREREREMNELGPVPNGPASFLNRNRERGFVQETGLCKVV